MSSVRRILQIKGFDVWSTTPDTMVYDALRIMGEKDVGALVVLENGKMVGILSERDYARKIVLSGKTSRETRVGDVMTKEVFTVHPEQTVQECMQLMLDHHIRHLPVMVDNEVMGVISIGDVVGDIIYQQKSSIQSLEKQLNTLRE
ncbi:MAG: CBS domain-containing protein [Chloroflexi bacterium]|nr:CBS domain-containing protein [Chloroflexota bacterium]